jgi:hypothetical protein
MPEINRSQRDRMRVLGYITAKEVAERTGKNLVTIYGWLKDGRVEGQQVEGRFWYVRVSSLICHLRPLGAQAAGLVAPPALPKAVG